jgi:hypothetical protein
MNREGPTLEHLLRRLIETPTDFLAEPHTTSGRGIVHVDAVAADLLVYHGHSATDLPALNPDDSTSARRRAGVSLLLCWLLADPELIAGKIPAGALAKLLAEGAGELASQNGADKYRGDSERREEFVRFVLARLDLRPCGETLAQGQDRLTALSSIERNRVLAASREAEARSRAIREALARKAARESADKYTRE